MTIQSVKPKLPPGFKIIKKPLIQCDSVSEAMRSFIYLQCLGAVHMPGTYNDVQCTYGQFKTFVEYLAVAIAYRRNTSEKSLLTEVLTSLGEQDDDTPIQFRKGA